MILTSEEVELNQSLRGRLGSNMKPSALRSELERLIAANDNDELSMFLFRLERKKRRPADVMEVLFNLSSLDIPYVSPPAMVNLGLYGARADRFFELIVERISDENSSRAIRFLALRAAASIRPDDTRWPNLLCGFVDHFPEEASDLVVKGRFYSPQLLVKLISLLQRDDFDVVWAAVDAIGSMGSKASAALEPLQKCLAHPSGLVSVRAAIAIASLQEHQEL